jgi:hypothetical protein
MKNPSRNLLLRTLIQFLLQRTTCRFGGLRMGIGEENRSSLEDPTGLRFDEEW